MNIHAIYAPFLTHFRSKRMRAFVEMFGVDDATSIVDVGGYDFNWTLAPAKPRVVLVNIEDEAWQRGRFRKVQGDGRNLAFGDNSFHIAYSNSVIEHVGHWEDQVAFANEIRRVAPRYFVQTPYKWFFIEPHLIAPFVHFLPRRIKRRLVRRCTIWGLVTKPDQRAVDAFLDYIRLLDKREMKTLFPEADIIEEKFFGLTKSLIAVRRGEASAVAPVEAFRGSPHPEPRMEPS
jgi:methyltransferase family protein